MAITIIITLFSFVYFIFICYNVFNDDNISKFSWRNCNTLQRILIILISGPIGWITLTIFMIWIWLFDMAGKINIKLDKTR